MRTKGIAPLRCLPLLGCVLGLSAAPSAAQQGPGEGRVADAPKAAPLRLVPNEVSLPGGRTFRLNLPEGYAIRVAASGLRRARFLAKSPDGRIFVTDLHSLGDNTKGVVYILDRFDADSKTFKKLTPWLGGLRNPNSLAFWKDREGADWFYLALTEHLVRFKFTPGEERPTAKPEVLATFPAYGLDYKYGGWHLTRTVLVGGNDKIYVSVGSSCNVCEEKEEVRATILEMNADGSQQKTFARGMRNAVGMRWIGGRLVATNMGADHLGDHRPADTLHFVKEGAHYGWPYCYQSGAKVLADTTFKARARAIDCRTVPPAHAAFDSHSSPLGLEYFDDSDSFLVALHGGSKRSLKRGYRVVRVRGNRVDDFITGFLRDGRVHGRPVDILRYGQNGFLLTDDHAGAVYFVYRK
jgi:glucose/arabinose dehydrogenase